MRTDSIVAASSSITPAKRVIVLDRVVPVRPSLRCTERCPRRHRGQRSCRRRAWRSRRSPRRSLAPRHRRPRRGRGRARGSRRSRAQLRPQPPARPTSTSESAASTARKGADCLAGLSSTTSARRPSARRPAADAAARLDPPIRGQPTNRHRGGRGARRHVTIERPSSEPSRSAGTASTIATSSATRRASSARDRIPSFR